MVRSSQRYSLMRHSLLSAYGSKWADRNLLMFTVYIDDSGSAPEHKMAIASGIVLPAKQLERFESEWNRFLEKEGIPDFHSSECLARNPHSVFTDWDEARVKRVFARVRQITFKYSIQAFCIGVNKQDYNEVVPKDMLKRIGSHYTWAVSSVIGLAYDWTEARAVKMEYVFDTVDKSVKREIDEAMEFSEGKYPGYFVGHYSFRLRKDIPGLQAADLFAWSCYQAARHTRFNDAIHPLAQESWEAYRSAGDGNWATIQSLSREGLELWVKEKYLSQEDVEINDFKVKKKEARMPRSKKKD